MSTLRICLFGVLRIDHDGFPSEVKVARTAQALLAYLLLHRHRSHPRDVLAGLFWGDHRQDRAHSCLNTTLWRLRAVLEPKGVPRATYLVTTPTGELSFNRESDYWLDVAVFEAHVNRVLARPIHAMASADAQDLENALQLYAGELLEGFHDDWALRERERLRLLYLNSLTRLMTHYRQGGAYDQSLACGQRILQQDPLREEIHRDMMRLYLASGQRAQAVRQYQTCRETLAAELNIRPMEETDALYAQIVPKAPTPQLPPPFAAEQAGLQHALQHLTLAMQAFDKARRQLRRSIQLFERLGEQEDDGPTRSR